MSRLGRHSLGLVLCVVLHAAAWPATFVVDSTTDAVDAAPGNGVCATAGAVCTLRAAVQEANALPGTDLINVPPGTYVLTIAGVGEDSAASGDLDITQDVTIAGTAPSLTIIDGNALDRVFEIYAPLATITGLMLRNGSINAEGGGIRVSGSSSLTLQSVTVSGSHVFDKKGGGIKLSSGTLTLTNVTLSGNSAKEGGALFNQSGTVLMTNCTLTANTATSKGSGIVPGSGSFTVTNTIVAANSGAPNCDSSIGPGSNNLDSDGSCGFGLTAAPRLGPLQDNGGAVFTHAPLVGSPAIDGGTNTGCPGSDATGSSRPIDGNGDLAATCDMGAFEEQGIWIAGTIFEDADFEGVAANWDGGVADRGLPNVDVELYTTTNGYLASTVTDANGAFIFPGAGSGSVKVRARSSTIGDADTLPKGGLNGSVPATWPYPLAEMTWGAGTAAYGGQLAGVDDTATGNDAGPGDTWVAVTVAGSAVSGVNLGFAFNLIVNTADDANAGNVRSKQGSLRQFLKNANAIGSAAANNASSSEFRIPASDANYNGTTGVYRIDPVAVLPTIVDAGTTLDGSTQSANLVNSNTATLGVGGFVGVENLTLDTLDGPEIEIRGTGAAVSGIRINANSVTVRGLAIHGFGTAEGEAGVRVDNGVTNALIERNVVGSPAAAFGDPDPAPRNYEGIYSGGADNGIIRENMVGFNGVRGILLALTSTGWTVENSEIRDNGLGTTDGDGIALNASGENSIVGNLITGSSSQGIVVTAAGAAGNDVTNNSVTGNGVGITAGVAQSSGITIRGSAGANVVELNKVYANYGSGLAVNDAATGIKITRNSFHDNGTIVARNSGPATGQIGIDLNGSGDDANLGTSPFRTRNDSGDGDTGGNALLNFPVLNTATILGANLELAGWARPGSVIELFIAAPDPLLFGEGQTQTITLTEGGTGAGAGAGEDPYADADGGTGTYGPGNVNGIDQGTDSTNRFRFTFPLPAGVSGGTQLTATARDGSNNTSEFSGLVAAQQTAEISGTVFEDVNHGGGAGRDRATAAAAAPAFVVGRPGVTVELYGVAGNFLDTTVTDAAGDYSFIGLANGDYQVRVVNETVDSSRPGATGAEWPVQTFRTDASSGTETPVTGEVGGASPQLQDAGPNAALANLGSFTAQSVAPVKIQSTTSVVDVDFGFNFDLIVNTNTTGQGSLRQFILNSNTLGNTNLAQAGLPAGIEHSLFMIPSDADPLGRAQDPGFDAGRGVAVITPVTLLPSIGASDTALDGTTQTTQIGDTNGPSLGRGGNVGLTPLALAQVAGPEIEIVDGAALAVGVDVQASDTAVRGLAIYGFGAGGLADGNLRVGLDGTTNFTGVLIEDNVLGGFADSFSDPELALPGSRTSGTAVAIRGADSGILRRNLLGFAGRNAAAMGTGADDWTIESNEFRRGGLTDTRSDGLGITHDCHRAGVTGNLFVDNQGAGVDFFSSFGDHTLTDNTFDGNGWGGVETAGVRMFGSGGLVQFNDFTDQTGSGVLAVVADPAFPTARTPATRQRITRNRFSANGSNAIDVQTTLDIVAPGDGITLNDGTLLGDSTIANGCGTDASHGNEGLDTPIIDLVVFGPTFSTVRGRACPGAEVEIYRAVAGSGDTLSGTDYGEGLAYLATATAAAGTGLFESLVVPGLSVGDRVAAIAIDSDGNTSEFSANLDVEALKIVKRAFQLDGTPIADGSVLPTGTPFRFMLYVDNPAAGVTDATLRDVLDAVFVYKPGSMKLDNTLASSVVCPGGVCDEAAIFAQVSASGATLGDGDAVAAPTDADAGSYSSGTATLDLGNNNNANNARLDIAADSVLALIFTTVVQ